jgi:molybdopterin converting factor small subunit
VLSSCSFLVDGDPVGTRDQALVALADGGTVEVLPPFAGG